MLRNCFLLLQFLMLIIKILTVSSPQLWNASCLKLLKMVTSTAQTGSRHSTHSALSRAAKTTRYTDTRCWPVIVMATGLQRNPPAKVKQAFSSVRLNDSIKGSQALGGKTNSSHCFHSFSTSCYGPCVRCGSRGRSVIVRRVSAHLDPKTTEAESLQIWAEQVGQVSESLNPCICLFCPVLSCPAELMFFFCLILQQLGHRSPSTGLQEQHWQPVVRDVRLERTRANCT